MMNSFKGRSLCVIDDFSKQERLYLFSQVRKLKKAIAEDDRKTIDSFRINDSDFGIYEVFLEDSTRTKESFRNAANFHHAKLTEMSADNSSFNKGESYADTFNTLCGYNNRIFIIRSRVEGVCRYLSEECCSYAKRNDLPFTPAFINAGDGKHEHPTQELLDEYSFLEDNDWKTDSLHIALVGDLYHGRTVHSKADGLKLWDKVRVDLIAPDELSMPESYVTKMKENGFEVRAFKSIEEYLKQSDIATKWYFTRPQLERMGEKILAKADSLRASITFQKQFMEKLPEGTKFYHPLPRHKVHPTIPTFLDDTPLNGWEKQSINGMYCRIVLLALVAGKIGDDFKQEKKPETAQEIQWIIEAQPKSSASKKEEISEGVRPIRDGIVIDHICKGDSPEEIRRYMILIRKVMGLDGLKGGEWVSQSSSGDFKGIIFRPGKFSLDHKQIKRLAAVAPGCTLNIIENGKVAKKYRTSLPPRIYNFDDLMCTNEACISNDSQNEHVQAMFIKTLDNRFTCAYCGRVHTFKEIFKH
ncbi:MAG: bifunctional aspartate carbamoyltransferase catalytic subunit/aspartate carbamoyltransferase regulatory subunit [Spirochaetales bacterium]|nr:bifunctional aspartate carbamoyltransferase catalytic subunit/aspartate carbamoyltransferase regulatory subunit [Spirochaetales bacterium]MBO7349110.1 bifunctional aspartate carbamoyltransferase catalytic subunit/aspartate carbamoyltransferase regulatory subunit [Spirochaetales bacterium]MBP5756526.1 bifunctional aspartate carbamoyltransferase catalytic subunit/aspartate carbamoyltransferase regulatory subunit [Spirochaetales bacterium]